jgi:hypothetical protein
MNNLEHIHLIQLLVEWEKYSEEQACMHDKARYFYTKCDFGIAIPAILLSMMGGVGNIGVASQCESSSLNIIFGTIALISSTMFSIHRYLNISEYKQQHDFYGDEFEKLSKEIHLQLIIYNDEHKTYASLVEFSKECKKKIDNILDKAPPIPKHIAVDEEKKRGGLTIMSTTTPIITTDA